MASNYYVIYPDELYHHGVKGMKWGVRKAGYTAGHYVGDRAQSVRNVLKYGWRKGHGKNVYRRLQETNRDTVRKSRMNAAQKQSLKNATAYWKNRAEGKGIYGSGKRNIIKRSFDASRSYSAGERFIANTIGGLSNSAANSHSWGEFAVNSVASSASAMVGDEFVSRLFGHF